MDVSLPVFLTPPPLSRSKSVQALIKEGRGTQGRRPRDEGAGGRAAALSRGTPGGGQGRERRAQPRPGVLFPGSQPGAGWPEHLRPREPQTHPRAFLSPGHIRLLQKASWVVTLAVVAVEKETTACRLLPAACFAHRESC